MEVSSVAGVPWVWTSTSLQPVRNRAVSEAHLSSTSRLPPSPPPTPVFHESVLGTKKVGDLLYRFLLFLCREWGVLSHGEAETKPAEQLMTLRRSQESSQCPSAGLLPAGPIEGAARVALIEGCRQH